MTGGLGQFTREVEKEDGSRPGHPPVVGAKMMKKVPPVGPIYSDGGGGGGGVVR